MQVLVIWDQCGVEPIELYLATGKLAQLALKCDGQYINTSNLPKDAPINTLFRACFYDDAGEKKPPRSDFTKVETRAAVDVDRVAICGFLP